MSHQKWIVFVLIIFSTTSCKKDISKEEIIDDGFNIVNLNINANTAYLDIISNNNLDIISSWGICFSSNNVEPNLNDSIVYLSNDSISGQIIYIENLIPNTNYYIRIFFEKNNIVNYSDVYQFKTTSAVGSLAEIEHLPITYIYCDSAVLNYSIKSEGGSEIIERGFCISRAGTPNITDIKLEVSSILSDVSLPLYKLKPSTIYYVRPYAINSAGTSYGKQRVFITDSVYLNEGMKGGNLFYIFKEGDKYYVENEFHGLVYFPHLYHQSSSQPWSEQNTFVGANNTSIGGGYDNTMKIIQAYNQGEYMAWKINELKYRGYDDWYLINKEELELAGKHFSLNNLWTSTEVDSSYAYARVNNIIQPVLKSTVLRSIIVRRF